MSVTRDEAIAAAAEIYAEAKIRIATEKAIAAASTDEVVGECAA